MKVQLLKWHDRLDAKLLIIGMIERMYLKKDATERSGTYKHINLPLVNALQ